MRFTKAVFCVCALAVFGAFTYYQITPSTASADPTQAKVDYSKGFPEKAAGGSHLDLPNPMNLGDSASSPEWGKDDKYGAAKFTHQNHTEKYKISCKTCHHTNGDADAAKTEDVQRCVNCHKAEGNDKNPSDTDGNELWVKEAFHAGVAGCIECHKKEQAKNPKSTAATSCAGCHASK